MVRSFWKAALALMLCAGLQAPNVSAQPAAAPATVTIQENGKNLRCRVMSSWQVANGGSAFKVQVLSTGETLTIMQEQPGVANRGAAVPMRIWHWGTRTAAPVGAPVEPMMTMTAPPPTVHNTAPTQTAANQSWNQPKVLSEGAPTIVQVSRDPVLPKGTVIVSQPVCKHGKTNCPICSPESYVYQSDKFNAQTAAAPQYPNQPPMGHDENASMYVKVSPNAPGTAHNYETRPRTSLPAGPQPTTLGQPVAENEPGRPRPLLDRFGKAKQPHMQTAASGPSTKPVYYKPPTFTRQGHEPPAPKAVQTPLPPVSLSASTTPPRSTPEPDLHFGGPSTKSVGTPPRSTPEPELRFGGPSTQGFGTPLTGPNLDLSPAAKSQARPFDAPPAAPLNVDSNVVSLPPAAIVSTDGNKIKNLPPTPPINNVSKNTPTMKAPAAFPVTAAPNMPAAKPSVLDVPTHVNPHADAMAAKLPHTLPATKPGAQPAQIAKTVPSPKELRPGGTSLLKDVTIPPVADASKKPAPASFPSEFGKKPSYLTPPDLNPKSGTPPAIAKVHTPAPTSTAAAPALNPKSPPAPAVFPGTPPGSVAKDNPAKDTAHQSSGLLARLFNRRETPSGKSDKTASPPPKSLAPEIPRTAALGPDMPRTAGLAPDMPHMTPLSSEATPKSLRIPDFSASGKTLADFNKDNSILAGVQVPKLDSATTGLHNKNVPTSLSNSAAIELPRAPLDVSKYAAPSVAPSAGKANSLTDIFENMKSGAAPKTLAQTKAPAPIVADVNVERPLAKWPEAPATATPPPAPGKSVAQASPPMNLGSPPPARINFTEAPTLLKTTDAAHLHALPPGFDGKPAIATTPAAQPTNLVKKEAPYQTPPAPLVKLEQGKQVATSSDSSVTDRLQALFSGQKPETNIQVAQAKPKMAESRIPEFPISPSAAEPLSKNPAAPPQSDFAIAPAAATAPSTGDDSLKPALWRDLFPLERDDHIKQIANSEPPTSGTAKEPARTPFSTAILRQTKLIPAPKDNALESGEPKATPPFAMPEPTPTASSFPPIASQRSAKSESLAPKEQTRPSEFVAPKEQPSPSESERNWREMWGKAHAPAATLPGQTARDQPMSVTHNSRYPDPLLHPEQFTPNKAEFLLRQNGAAPKRLPAAKTPDAAEIDPGLQPVSHEEMAAPGSPAKRGLLNRLRTVSQTQQSSVPPPEHLASMPPGAQSVVAAGNGFGPRYVPVPMMTVPDPTRPPAPPPPSVPEPPDPALYVNAFSQPMPPPQQPAGPSMNAFPLPQQVPPGAMPQGYPQQYGQMPTYGQMPMVGQMPVNPQAMMQASYYQQGYPQPQMQMPANYPQRPTAQFNVPNYYQGPTPPNPAMQMQMLQMQQMQMQQMQMQQMQMQMQGMPSYLPAPNVMTGQAQQSSNASAEHLALLQSSPYPAQREWAANNLTTFDWQKQPEILQAMLTSAQQDPAASVRAAAIYNIASKGMASPLVLATFEGLKNDADPRVRHQATQAIGHLQVSAPQMPAITPAN